jgi:acylglycerol lipase
MQENWLKRPDGTELYVRFNQPDQCKATLILIHGVAENIKRYDAFFEELGKAGIKCGGYDQRGFGQTCKKNGNRGHLGEEQDHFDDITAVCEFLKNGPLFIMGQSMGGGTALKYAYSHPDNIVGVIGASPFIDFAPGSAPLLHEKIAMAILPAIVPKLALPKPLDVGHLSNDPRVGEEFSKDELYLSLMQKSFIHFGTYWCSVY